MTGCPDLISPLVGWRAWKAEQDDAGKWRLRSCIRPGDWEPGAPLEATCSPGLRTAANRAQHFTPARRCTCGIYAAKQVISVMEYVMPLVYMTPWTSMYPPKPAANRVRVFGAVKLWGKIVEYSGGYRAMTAYPSRLWVMVDGGVDRGLYDDVAFDLTEYRVPVGFVEGRRDRAGLKEKLEHLVADHPDG